MLYRSLLRPALFRLEPEAAHEFALHTLSTALGTEAARRAASRRFSRSPFGEIERFGLRFKNPVGLAAGFDKNGKVARQLAALGFGFVEVGTVTHLPQAGNPRPRLFRLPEDRALVNRLGFNNEGAAALARRIARDGKPDCVLGVNIGKSRAVAVEEAAADYLASFDLVRPFADYVAVNVSSPNTPCLRELQRADALESLLTLIQRRNRETGARPAGDGDAKQSGVDSQPSGEAVTRGPLPLLVKVAPDLGEGELELIADVALRAGIAGVIATNTTTSRDGLRRTAPARVAACGEGGLSGAPLRARSTEVVASLYRLSRGALTIVGVGGVFTARDAWEKVCAGASLVQIYTGFVYQGATAARDINDGLAELARRDGFASLDAAVGCKAEEAVGF
ncbi:MAG TPA: quinone-dependent dihydroorotate dehydrogenase [Pyrinomonadaceae bacterium]|nr:quinone-dependent dihydroorotate dehydrogenase [Pyrinomonadaceae bacterium]